MTMEKFLAVLQFIGAAILTLASVATLVNLVFISMRPETISVVNTIIGQGVLIICMSALANILFRKAWNTLRGPGTDSEQDKAAKTGSE